MLSSPNRRNMGTSSPMIGASRFPVGAPSTAQQNASATMTSGPYRHSLGFLGRTIVGVNAAVRAFLAWLRCHPSSRTTRPASRPFAAFPARLYLVAIATDTACLCANESPITRASPPDRSGTAGAPYARIPS